MNGIDDILIVNMRREGSFPTELESGMERREMGMISGCVVFL